MAGFCGPGLNHLTHEKEIPNLTDKILPIAARVHAATSFGLKLA